MTATVKDCYFGLDPYTLEELNHQSHPDALLSTEVIYQDTFNLFTGGTATAG